MQITISQIVRAITMLQEVTIKNFKCFKDLYVPELGRMTLISGKNNVGKTSLLEAIFLFLDRGSPHMLLRQYGWRGIPKVDLEPSSLYGPFFHKENLQKEMSIEIKIDGSQHKTLYKFTENFVPPTPPSKPVTSASTTEDIPPISVSALDIVYTHKNKKIQTSHHWVGQGGKVNLTTDKMIERVCPAHFLSTSINLGKDLVDVFSKLSQQNKEDEIIEFLKIIEPRLEAIKIITNKDIVTLHGKLIDLECTLELNLMGQGLVKLLRIILAIIAAQNGVVFVDEFENGVHHSVLSKVWLAIAKSLRKYNCQLITTTHSDECLKASCNVYKKYPEDYRHIRLDRKDGEFSAKLSNYEMVASAIKTNLELR